MTFSSLREVHIYAGDMSKVYSFRLDKENLREAQAIAIINS